MLIFSLPALSVNKLGRLGLGITNHLENDLQAFSMKIQKSRTMAIGGHLGIQADSSNSLYAVGGKLYRMIYEEPQLEFYTALEASLFTYISLDDETTQGYHLQGLFGSEFHLQGVESIGFSFEFGLGLSRAGDDVVLKTLGHNIIQSAVHFYL